MKLMSLMRFSEVVAKKADYPDVYERARRDISDRIWGGLCDNFWFSDHGIDALKAYTDGDGLSDEILIEFFDDIGYILFDGQGRLWERWSD